MTALKSKIRSIPLLNKLARRSKGRLSKLLGRDKSDNYFYTLSPDVLVAIVKAFNHQKPKNTLLPMDWTYSTATATMNSDCTKGSVSGLPSKWHESIRIRTFALSASIHSKACPTLNSRWKRAPFARVIFGGHTKL
jgi:hypothetical protein